MSWLYDMHFHLGWMSDPASFACQAEHAELGGFGVTVTPAEYRALIGELQGKSHCLPALGFHPWYAHVAKLNQFQELAQTTHAIGEIGLDFRRTPEPERMAATAEFRAICEAIQPKSVISLHAVDSAEVVLDVLEATGRLKDCVCIFHWFLDSGEAFTRARRSGCMFSINPRQLETRRGRAYATQIAAEQLLVETDLPYENRVAVAPKKMRILLTQTQEKLGVDTEKQAKKLLLQAMQ